MNYLANPQMLWLLPVPLVFYIFLRPFKRGAGDALKIPFINDLKCIAENKNSLSLRSGKYVSHLMNLFLLGLAWICFVCALCCPQNAGEPKPLRNEGRDILLVLDISNSMRERDFEYAGKYYDRMSAVKSVVNKFIDERTQDKIGLVLFGTRAYLQAPLTYDKHSLKEILANTEAGMAGNSTSIGDAIGLALKNLTFDTKNPDNKVIILLTDGENNDGSISFPEAIKLAKDEKIKVYTIGAAGDETSFFGGLFSMPSGSGLDERGLQQLATETKGAYFRAKDVNSLAKIYEKINMLEPQMNDAGVVREVKDLYYIPATLGLLLLILLWLINEKRKI